MKSTKKVLIFLYDRWLDKNVPQTPENMQESKKTFIFAFMRVLFFDNPGSVSPSQLEEDMYKLPRFRRDRMLLLKRFEDRVLGVEAFLLLLKALREDYGILSCPDMVYGVHGKPSFARHPEIFFNLSHCRSGAMCVVADREVGCDIESANRKVSEAVMSRCFNRAEAEKVRSSSNPSLEFARIWTRKEAVGKFLGCGIDDTASGILEEAESAGLKIISGMNLARNYVYSICVGNANDNI